MATEYRVQLDAFEGPLDLLLYLIRKAEVEIVDIPIAEMTDQFLSYLGDLDKEHVRIDIDTAGEFLVMAATLMEIKSRMIARASEPESVGSVSGEGDQIELEPSDPRADLVRQLLEYKKYRDMADGLEARRQLWSRRYGSGPAGVDDEQLEAALHDLDQVDLEDVEVVDLVQAFARIIGSVDLTRIGEHEVVSDETPIELHAADIMDALENAKSQHGKATTLRSILAHRTRAEMVGLFLALLDLIRQQRVRVQQEDEGEIIIEPRENRMDSADRDDHARQDDNH